jgi:hypothetical protein
LAAVEHWRWSDGLLPDAAAPHWRMDALRDRFVEAFSPEVLAAGSKAAASAAR